MKESQFYHPAYKLAWMLCSKCDEYAVDLENVLIKRDKVLKLIWGTTGIVHVFFNNIITINPQVVSLGYIDVS